MRFFFTEKQIDKLIEEAVDQMQDYLSKNEKAEVLIAAGAPAPGTPSVPAAPDK